jgi:hypothetical protein
VDAEVWGAEDWAALSGLVRRNNVKPSPAAGNDAWVDAGREPTDAPPAYPGRLHAAAVACAPSPRPP